MLTESGREYNPSKSPSACIIARRYLKRGWAPVPVPRGKKGPTEKGWQSLEITRDNVEQYFDDDEMNVGVKLGRASGGLG